jgi:hypothetical protein
MNLDKQTILEFKEKGILNYPDNCEKCKNPLEIKDCKKKSTDSSIFKPRCKKYGCQKEHSLIKYSFFGNFKLNILLLIEFIRFWAIKDSITNGFNYLKTKNIGIDRNTVGRIFH